MMMMMVGLHHGWENCDYSNPWMGDLNDSSYKAHAEKLRLRR
jgi:hypothetical protein